MQILWQVEVQPRLEWERQTRHVCRLCNATRNTTLKSLKPSCVLYKPWLLISKKIEIMNTINRVPYFCLFCVISSHMSASLTLLVGKFIQRILCPSCLPVQRQDVCHTKRNLAALSTRSHHRYKCINFAKHKQCKRHTHFITPSASFCFHVGHD